MKKIIIISLFIMTILFSGCTKTNDIHFEIDSLILSEKIIQQNDVYNLEFFIVNPTQNTFTGNIEYKYETSCLSSSGSSSENIEVNPNNKIGKVKKFIYNGRSSSTTCIQVPLKINILLYDKSGSLKDSFEAILRFTE